MAVTSIIDAQAWHIKSIADRMRSADRDELAALGYAPEVAMRVSLGGEGEAWTGMIDGVPVCMFGVNSSSALTPHRGLPWMMGTESLDRHAILFLKRCKAQVDRMQSLFPLLENWIAVSNVVAVTWLEWLGFSLHETKMVGSMEFIRFTREAQVDNPVQDSKQIKFKTAVEDIEHVMLNAEQIHVEPEHRFAEGLYSRTLTMPKNTVWASRVHLHENFAFIMKGSCIVVSEDGPEEYHAPCVMKTKAGTKRILRILEEDCTWVTVHALPPELGEDIEKIEAFLAVNTLEEYQALIEHKNKEGISCKS